MTATTAKTREVSMTEGKIVNKYTLVPVGAVLAAIITTAAVMNYMWSDKSRVTVLETTVVAQQKEIDSLRADLTKFQDTVADRLQQQTQLLQNIDRAVVRLTERLNADTPLPGAGRQ